jgi:hypothetical protein
MWIMTTAGFFSIVADRDHPDQMLVRARDRDHLVRLSAQCDLSGAIHETPNADYACRMFLSREEFLRVLDRVGRDVDYPNFKDAAAHVFGHDAAYVQALHDVWGVMYFALQVGASVSADSATGRP